MRIKFNKTQENSDATNDYNVTWDEMEVTVDNICDAVLAHAIQTKERGKIYISIPSDPWYGYVADYFHSVMEFHDAYFDFKHRKVHRIWANGGYGAMSYYLTLE